MTGVLGVWPGRDGVGVDSVKSKSSLKCERELELSCCTPDVLLGKDKGRLKKDEPPVPREKKKLKVPPVGNRFTGGVKPWEKQRGWGGCRQQNR